MTLAEIFYSCLPSILVGIFLWYFNRKSDRHYKATEDRAELRRKEGRLSLEMQMATAKLSYATATALKRGYANGEVEDGIEAYEEAKNNYYKFINDQYVEHINERK